MRIFVSTALVVGIVTLAMACERPNPNGVRNPDRTVSDKGTAASPSKPNVSPDVYVPPDTSTIPHDKTGEMIRYGRDLLVNFVYYLGPNGKVGKYGGNLLGCQNCHLDAGTRPYGLSYFSAHARYPQYRPREGKILSLAERVNSCVERPINGRPIPLDSKEMIAIVTYMKWLGQGVPVNNNVPGDALKPIAYLDRPASSDKGEVVYRIHCMRCHGEDGQGKLRADKVAYEYPPLWGMKSYQYGTSMHRVIKAAQFIKSNMPFDLARWDKPVLTDEEALDVAAYINDDDDDDRKNIKRPHPHMEHDYPDIAEKPVDFYHGPFADPFTLEQHKFGPYKPIIEWRKKNGQTTGY